MTQINITSAHESFQAQLGCFATATATSIREMLSYQAGMAQVARDLWMGAARDMPAPAGGAQDPRNGSALMHMAQARWNDAVRDTRALNDRYFACLFHWTDAMLDSVNRAGGTAHVIRVRPGSASSPSGVS